ncbi:histidine kinase dimerization/phosphoacceptor domain -containing protein [Pontixanthobacter luteolus]|uniref:histidine kinase dimerization/phosphoacceptor domain -containing protein n=1 Tax=Pontixanthobacter luteolus TaxID=295089 RepID=UPI002302E44C|nr:histidine kinase dimerization/phosphoacceptor domain -containing protein [Pontixanthobacter luteolus]
MKPSLHPQEEERLRELHRYGILDTEREKDFDELVEIASDICETPVSVVNFIDEGRQWFKAEVGLGVRSTPIETSLCGHVILQGDFVEIPDTLQDERMADNPLCTSEPGFRFYAGAVLKGANGLPLGTLCVLDNKPRTLTDRQRKVLRVLSKHVMRELNLRIALEEERVLRREVDHRVKNSLASIGAMLSMKARRTSHEVLRLELDDASTRIRSLASLHAELHELEAGGHVDLKSLFERVQTDLRYLIPEAATLSIEVEAIEATPQFANALLLIVNEFVSNSVKHGSMDGIGAITVRIKGDARSWSIVCRDNGKATKLDAERAMSKSGLGTRVIHALANSLNANAEWAATGDGMELKVTPQHS